MPINITQQNISCPKCSTTISNNPGYTQWCDQCNWNLLPPNLNKKYTLLDRLYVRLGRKWSKVLFENVIRNPRIIFFQHFSHGLGTLLAIIFLGINLIMVVGGLWLIIKKWPDPGSVIEGLISLTLAWILRPHLGKWPKKEILNRKEHPSIYGLMDEIAHKLGTSKIHGIIIDEKFNASITEIGWRRRKLLRIGLPLFAVLTSEERLAILGHEFGHGLNKDTFFLRLTWIAIYSMCRWHDLLCYPTLWEEGFGFFNLFIVPFKFVARLIAKVILLLVYGVLYLSWSASQRAEYMADLAGARLSSIEAMASALEKVNLANDFYFLVQHYALNGIKDEDLFEAVRGLYDFIPEREKERRRRIQEVYASQLDSTHPPNRYRITFLQQYSKINSMKFEPTEMDSAENEIFKMKQGIQEKLLDFYLDKLCY